MQPKIASAICKMLNTQISTQNRWNRSNKTDKLDIKTIRQLRINIRILLTKQADAYTGINSIIWLEKGGKLKNEVSKMWKRRSICSPERKHRLSFSYCHENHRSEMWFLRMEKFYKSEGHRVWTEPLHLVFSMNQSTWHVMQRELFFYLLIFLKGQPLERILSEKFG